MFRLTLALALFGFGFAGALQPRLSDDIEGRIVGGEATDIENFPYQVALIKNGSLFCGGSLYSEVIVITAAHCLETYYPYQIKVRVGSSLYASDGELISVKTFKYHENYNSKLMTNDVALIRLATPVILSNKIQTIPLAELVPKAGTIGYVTGWGTDEYLTGNIQSVLRVAEVQIIPEVECASSSYYFGSKILPSMVCAYEGGKKDACQGDSGGPLASGGKLVGIVSWGSGCAYYKYPGVYASVPVLRQWIIKNAGSLSA